MNDKDMRSTKFSTELKEMEDREKYCTPCKYLCKEETQEAKEYKRKVADKLSLFGQTLMGLGLLSCMTGAHFQNRFFCLGIIPIIVGACCAYEASEIVNPTEWDWDY